MLVLGRKVGEAIVIGGDIIVTVLEIRGGEIRLGIVAPKQVPVFRQEVWVKIIQATETEDNQQKEA